jgi:DHA1 family tetracycline resistance protein-like MFS transporter
MKLTPTMWPLLWIMIFDHTCLNIAFPILTFLFFDHHSSLFPIGTSDATRSMWYGYCLSLPHILNFFFTPILSAMSDRFGRRKLLLVSIAGALLFSVIAGLGVMLGVLPLLLFGRVIQGVFSRTNPIAQAAVADISLPEEKNRNMGYLQFAISIGAFIGPILGGYFANRFFFATFNFSLPYFLGAIFAALSLLMTWYYFRETYVPKTSSWQLSLNVSKSLFLDKNILFISAILLLSQLSWGMYYQFIPPILKTVLHFDAKKLGLFVGLIALWLALATVYGIQLLEKFFCYRCLSF